MGAIWDSIVGGFAEVIKFFASFAGGNTAIGIIIFTIIIRTLILPLTLKAVRSSRVQQQLAPYVKEINERYKTKQGERLSQEKAAAKQAETMGLYKKFGVNPTASCLPVLIQIPVFFAVYGAVQKSVGTSDPLMGFVQAGWNALSPDAAVAAKSAALADSGLFWIKSLTAPDPLYILPILMVAFQFATSWMAIPKGGGPDENTRRINGIMKWTPLIFGFTALQFPAGPVLYWTVSSIYAAVQQYWITGFNSLADFPGLGWLPQKELPKIELKERVIDPSKPQKKTLMERLAEQQDRLAQERAGQGSADAGRPTAETFGRRADAGPLGSKSKELEGKSNGTNESIWDDTEISPSAKVKGVERNGETYTNGKGKPTFTQNQKPGVGAPPKARPKDDDTMRDAYRQISRPPKKVPSSGPSRKKR